LRHGATKNNVARPPLLQGCGSDLGLALDGLRQARQTAELFRALPLAAVYGSNLLRSIETAQIIATPHGLEAIQLEALSEVDVGRWEGRSWDEIAATDPQAYRQIMDDPARHGYPDGETLLQVESRATPALRQLMASHRGRQVVVVAHNAVNRVFLATLLQIPLSRARRIRQDNCGVNVIGYRDGEMELVTLNAVFHLQSSHVASIEQTRPAG
jgi:broad specificity phosphatase PhoE